jgi:hypothetical protein
MRLANNSMKYGNSIEGLVIDNTPVNYPVVNEREIRGAAGIMFLLGILVFSYTLLTRDFTYVYIIVPVFWFDFFLKTIFHPNLSIFGFLAKPFVRKQSPEYVGAIQKRFAWAIGLTLATLMLVFVVIGGIRGWLPMSICTICLFFMWLESTMGICVGCNVYSFLIKNNIIKKPEIKPRCAGNVCSIE